MKKLLRKLKIKSLQQKHKRLLEEAYSLSKVDRIKSDEKTAEADSIGKVIASLLADQA